METTAVMNRKARPPDLPAVEGALERNDIEAAAKGIGRLVDTTPGDLDTLRRVLHAAMESGQWEIANTVVERIRALAAGGDAVRMAESEYLVWRREFRQAREVLAGSTSENIVTPALVTILDHFEPCGGDGGEGHLELAPHLLWFEPVLTLLLFFLERAMEATSPSPQLHKARTAHFRPVFGPEYCPRPRRRVFEFLRSRKRRRLGRHEYEVDMLLHEGKLDGSVLKLRRWLEEDPEAFGTPSSVADPRGSLLLAVLFVQGHFDDVVALLDTPAGGEAPEKTADTASLVAYAELARGKTGRARRPLESIIKTGKYAAEVAHLFALIQLRSGAAAERVIPWLRRAIQENDIAMVELARQEMRFLESQ